jgi:hypothetical protein
MEGCQHEFQFGIWCDWERDAGQENAPNYRRDDGKASGRSDNEGAGA